MHYILQTGPSLLYSEYYNPPTIGFFQSPAKNTSGFQSAKNLIRTYSCERACCLHKFRICILIFLSIYTCMYVYTTTGVHTQWMYLWGIAFGIPSGTLAATDLARCSQSEGSVLPAAVTPGWGQSPCWSGRGGGLHLPPCMRVAVEYMTSHITVL